MNRDKILLHEDLNFIKKFMDKVFKKPKKTFKKDLIDAIAKVSREAKKQGKTDEILRAINPHQKRKLRKLEDLLSPARQIKEEYEEDEPQTIYEGFRDYFGPEAIKNAYGALSFYPILMIFLEIDKILRASGDASLRASIVYIVIWLAVISGKAGAQQIFTNMYTKAQAKAQADAEDDYEKNRPRMGFRTT